MQSIKYLFYGIVSVFLLSTASEALAQAAFTAYYEPGPGSLCSSNTDRCLIVPYDKPSYGDTVIASEAHFKCPVDTYVIYDGQLASNGYQPQGAQCSTSPPPPSCESPNYIDVVSGECVAPEEICFTTLETMADECVYIGEDDPNDEVPEGCVEDVNTGKQICLSENPGCYLVNGQEYCPEPAEVCGIKNGSFSCVHPEQEGCGYFNGEKVCFTPDGEKVESDSPDHPDNGGNLDGNEDNDMFDSRDPTEGGDPDNQIDSPIEPTQPGEEATEKTAREQLKELKKINDALDKMGEGEPLKEDGASSKIDDAIPVLLDSTGIDGLTDGMGSNPFGSGDLGTVPGIAQGLIPQGTCIAYSQDVIGFGTFEISCEDTALLRTILEWIFYVITAVYIFQLLTTPVRS